MHFRKASWVLLTALGSFIVFVGFISMYRAYFDAYAIGGVSVANVAAGREDVLVALRAIRGTSAAYAGGYGVLFLALVLGPYRRGEVWAWWALLGALVLPFIIVMLRMPVIGTRLGVSPALQQFVIGVTALLLDASRLRTTSARPTT